MDALRRCLAGSDLGVAAQLIGTALTTGAILKWDGTKVVNAVAGDVPAHKTRHATGGADALTPADIGAAAASHGHTYAGVDFSSLPAYANNAAAITGGLNAGLYRTGGDPDAVCVVH